MTVSEDQWQKKASQSQAVFRYSPSLLSKFLIRVQILPKITQISSVLPLYCSQGKQTVIHEKLFYYGKASIFCNNWKSWKRSFFIKLKKKLTDLLLWEVTEIFLWGEEDFTKHGHLSKKVLFQAEGSRLRCFTSLQTQEVESKIFSQNIKMQKQLKIIF